MKSIVTGNVVYNEKSKFISKNTLDINNKEEIIEFLKPRVLDYINSNTDDCILYKHLNSDGYGHIQFYINGVHSHALAHRIVYQIVNKCILTSDDIVIHSCDNPSCCNPKHLFIGTHNDNVQDKVNKDRQAKGINNGRYTTGYYSKYNPVKKPEPKFENLFGRSLSKEDIIAIKIAIRDKGDKQLLEVANELGIKYQTIRDINCGKTYRNVII